MSTTLTMQTVAFIISQDSSMPEQDILNDSGVKQAQLLSQGNDMIAAYQQYYNATIGTLNPQVAYTLTFLVSAATALNIIAGIPALKTRIQALDPQVTDVVTWGSVIAFG